MPGEMQLELGSLPLGRQGAGRLLIGSVASTRASREMPTPRHRPLLALSPPQQLPCPQHQDTPGYLGCPQHRDVLGTGDALGTQEAFITCSVSALVMPLASPTLAAPTVPWHLQRSQHIRA